MRHYFKSSLICLLSSAFMLSACQPGDGSQSGQSGSVVSTGKADIGGSFTLVNHEGKTVTEADFLGNPQLIYFGFTYCPDICPTALIQMARAQDALGAKGEDIQHIFISVDPERDTVESLNAYVTANGFPRGLIGLTGTEAQVEQAKTAFKVYAQKVEDDASASDYTVDHSSIIYFMDRQGELVGFFTHTSPVSEIVTSVKQYLKSSG